MIDINISAHPDRGPLKDQIEAAMHALGFTREAVGRQTELLSGAAQPISHAPSVASTADAADTADEPKKRRGRRGATSAEAEAPVVVDAAGETIKSVLDEPSVQQAISTGEERIGPDDAPEVEAQDKADEAAEMSAAKTEDKITHDSIRNALGAYVKTYGMDAALEDGPKLIGGVLGTPPSGEEAWKISAIPDDQEALQKVLTACVAAINGNPYGRAAA